VSNSANPAGAARDKGHRSTSRGDKWAMMSCQPAASFLSDAEDALRTLPSDDGRFSSCYVVAEVLTRCRCLVPGDVPFVASILFCRFSLPRCFYSYFYYFLHFTFSLLTLCHLHVPCRLLLYYHGSVRSPSILIIFPHLVCASSVT
jgi:hypothetical protein